MIYNIIGDIHGRKTWKTLVDKNHINVFVGDYFDPYCSWPFEQVRDNFLEIVEYKKSNPDNVVLLYGNHDYKYLPGIEEMSSRMDYENAQKITWMLVDAEPYFEGVAYPIGDKYIVTHAGITRYWKRKYLPDVEDISPQNMAKAINELWQINKRAFGFRANAQYGDYVGDCPEHSPIWIRPESLEMNNLYAGTKIIQIVGHTQFKDIFKTKGLVFVDCLGSVGESFIMSYTNKRSTLDGMKRLSR